jgi:CheY-like chemotaxis protein
LTADENPKRTLEMAKTILIVDDSASFRQVVAIILRGAGYEVVEAQDGKVGLEKLAEKRAHLIISDINMPVMDGFEFLKAVKAMPNSPLWSCSPPSRHRPRCSKAKPVAPKRGWSNHLIRRKFWPWSNSWCNHEQTKR